MSDINELLDFEKELQEVIQESKDSAKDSRDSSTTKQNASINPSESNTSAVSISQTPKTVHSSLQILRPLTAAALAPAMHPSRVALFAASKPLEEVKAAIRPISTAPTPYTPKPASGIVLEEDESIGIVRKRGFEEGPGAAALQALKAAKAPVSNPVGYVPPFSAVKASVSGAMHHPPPPPPLQQPLMHMHAGPFMPPSYPTAQQGQVYGQPIGPAIRSEVTEFQIEPVTQGEPKKKKHLRYAAGKVWNDPILAAWPTDSYDLFIGDLANDANDRLLEKCFKHYPSFLKARVVHKRGTANKFYGFVAFSDPFEMAKALREMNGKYCGSRPMTIKRSTSDQREFSREVYKNVNKVKK